MTVSVSYLSVRRPMAPGLDYNNSFIWFRENFRQRCRLSSGFLPRNSRPTTKSFRHASIVMHFEHEPWRLLRRTVKKVPRKCPRILVFRTHKQILYRHVSLTHLPAIATKLFWPISSLTRLDGFFIHIYISVPFFVISHREKVHLIHTLLHDLRIRHARSIALVVFRPRSNLPDVLSCVIANKRKVRV